MEKKTMKAAVYRGPNDIRLEDVPMPVIIEADDAIVRVTRSTICGTDLHIMHGALPVADGRILGHEFCGEIVSVGPNVKNVKVGDRVAANCVTQCGECFYCKRGEINHCENGGWMFGYTIDGCQAEYVRVPFASKNLYQIPANLSDEDVLLVGDILSTGYFGAERGDIKPGDTVAVMGCGPVGMCSMASARLFGPAQIIAVDTNDHRLEVAKRAGIADITLNPTRDDVVAEIRKLTAGRGADVTIEAVGAKATYETALKAARPSGRVSIIGLFAEPQELALNEICGKNLTIRMGWVHSIHMEKLISLIAKSKITTDFMLTHRAPLNDIAKGYDVFGSKKDNCIKWVVTPYQG